MDYSELIRSLPRADLPIPGVVGYMMQSADRLLVFFEFEEKVTIPLHSHGAQWGTVLHGRLDLTIGEELHRFGPGDSYVIPRDTPHGGVVFPGARILDLFEERDRYAPRPPGE
jgi:mannose-6-phosphate isomerase-like protein (cupin superfamily)